MTTISIAIAAAVLLVAAAVAAATSRFTSMLTFPKVHRHEESREHLRKVYGFDCAALEDSHPHEGFSFDSPRGYTLRGIVMHPTGTRKADSPEKEKAIVIVHGYTGNYSSMYPYAKVFLDYGFHVVLYDHRAHGLSDRKDAQGRRICCSMGYFESQDLKDLFDYIKPRFGDDCAWGILGESMGGAVIMQTARLVPELSFAIDDCGYSSMEAEAKAVFKSMHLPSWPTMQIGGKVIERRFGWRICGIDAAKAMKDTGIPMLFCHGDADTFVPTRMVNEVYEAKEGEKRLCLYKGSAHAQSILDHPDEYEANVGAFLRDIGLL